MKLPQIKKPWLIAGCIVLLFVVLNPSLKNFNEYQGDKGGTKKMNFIVCSVYQEGNENYVGILSNFLQIPKHESHSAYVPPPPTDGVTYVHVDSDITEKYDNPKRVNVHGDYISRTYQAIRDVTTGFDQPENKYRNSMINSVSYRHRIYSVLKENLTGFDKTIKQFDSSVVSNN